MRVQGRLTRPQAGLVRRILGGSGNRAPIGGVASAETSVVSFNGTSLLTANLGSGTLLTGIGAVVAYDAAGRSVVVNGGAVATDANAVSWGGAAYLGRDGDNTLYADGLYDSVTLWPVRGANASLAALSVAA